MAQTYDPAKVTVTVDGTVMTGFSEDSMIKISPTGDAVTPVVSVQGEVAYTENADKTGTLTLSFFQTSSALPRLRSLFNRKAEFAVVVSDANEGIHAAGAGRLPHYQDAGNHARQVDCDAGSRDLRTQHHS